MYAVRIVLMVNQNFLLFLSDRENEDSEINATIKITNVLFGKDLNIKSSKASLNLTARCKKAVSTSLSNC